ncbi:MAG: hypothetical protein KIT09_36095 [Bryobacteraceae bacterium]|nr:hypothetical protein [Bryobacteraceae bacterium]
MRSSVADADNGGATSYVYDGYGRPLTVTEAGLRTTTFSYNDTARTVTNAVDGLTTVETYDQLWRLWQTRGSGPTERLAQRGFKNNLAAGRMEAATNPYYAGAPGAATAGWTRTKVDAVDRVVEVAYFSGAALANPWTATANRTGVTTIGYNGNQATVTDPAGVVRRETRRRLGIS